MPFAPSESGTGAGRASLQGSAGWLPQKSPWSLPFEAIAVERGGGSR